MKRIDVRAVPLAPTYRLRTHLLDCTGTPEAPQRLRDGSPHPKTGRQLADFLNTAFAFGVATFTDRFGTYSGVIVADGFVIDELHSNEDGGGSGPASSGSFIANVSIREV